MDQSTAQYSTVRVQPRSSAVHVYRRPLDISQPLLVCVLRTWRPAAALCTCTLQSCDDTMPASCSKPHCALYGQDKTMLRIKAQIRQANSLPRVTSTPQRTTYGAVQPVQYTADGIITRFERHGMTPTGVALTHRNQLGHLALQY